MNYRSFTDRRVSMYGALFLITIVGSALTLSIVRAANTLSVEYDAQIQGDLAALKK